MISTIRFLRNNRYRREIGSTDSLMGYGVHDALVRRGIAEFVTSNSAISEPVAVLPESVPEPESTRGQKSRRYPKEPV